MDRFNLLFHVFRFDGNGNSLIEVFVCCYKTSIESEKQIRCYCRCYEDKQIAPAERSYQQKQIGFFSIRTEVGLPIENLFDSCLGRCDGESQKR